MLLVFDESTRNLPSRNSLSMTRSKLNRESHEHIYKNNNNNNTLPYQFLGVSDVVRQS